MFYIRSRFLKIKYFFLFVINVVYLQNSTQTMTKVEENVKSASINFTDKVHTVV